MSMTTQILAPSEAKIRSVLEDEGAKRQFFSMAEKSTPKLDLDKSWHGLHYLLTGSAWNGQNATGFLINGGDLMDLGMTSARVFWPKQVLEIHGVLDAATEDDLGRRFDPKAMMQEEIYP